MVICSICATPDVRRYVDADIVRHRSLRSISEKHGLSIRSVRRHLLHLPELLESESPAAVPNVYIGTINFNLVTPISEEDAQDGDGVDDPGEVQHEEVEQEELEHA